MMAPPRSDHARGFSPWMSQDHTGFNTGSSRSSIEASSAGT
jgi:hypothetical protein